jgi:phosphonate transport system substrate-binding protein
MADTSFCQFMALLRNSLFPLLPVVAFQAMICSASAAEEQVFRLGVINERLDRADFALNQFGKLHHYLGEQLRKKGIRMAPLVIADSIFEMTQKFRSAQVDGLLEGVFPTLFIERDSSRLLPSLLVWRKGQREYRTVFFVRKDSPINTLADLRGHTMVFESPRSTSAYFLPLVELKANDILLTELKAQKLDQNRVHYVFAGSEVNQGYWVQRGRADVGAFNDGDWQRLSENIRSQMRIIHETRPLLRWLFSFHRNVPEPVRKNVNETLLSLHETPEGLEALTQAERISRFESLTPDDLNLLNYWRNIVRRWEH